MEVTSGTPKSFHYSEARPFGDLAGFRQLAVAHRPTVSRATRRETHPAIGETKVGIPKASLWK
jgi:hypothetical protein